MEKISKLSDIAAKTQREGSLRKHCEQAEEICQAKKCTPIQLYHVSNIVRNLGCQNPFNVKSGKA